MLTLTCTSTSTSTSMPNHHHRHHQEQLQPGLGSWILNPHLASSTDRGFWPTKHVNVVNIIDMDLPHNTHTHTRPQARQWGRQADSMQVRRHFVRRQHFRVSLHRKWGKIQRRPRGNAAVNNTKKEKNKTL